MACLDAFLGCIVDCKLNSKKGTIPFVLFGFDIMLQHVFHHRIHSLDLTIRPKVIIYGSGVHSAKQFAKNGNYLVDILKPSATRVAGLGQGHTMQTSRQSNDTWLPSHVQRIYSGMEQGDSCW